jgi:hypothetical protein
MTKKNIQCSLAGLGRMTALQAQRRRGFYDITGFGCRRLREYDDIVDLRTARVIGVVGSGMAWVHSVTGFWEDDVVVGLRTASWAWGRGLCCRQCHRLGSGKMAARKGLDSGRQRWCGDSGEDTMRAWRL